MGANEFVHGQNVVPSSGGRPQHLHGVFNARGRRPTGQRRLRAGQRGYVSRPRNKDGSPILRRASSITPQDERAAHGPGLPALQQEGQGPGPEPATLPAGQTFTDEPGGRGAVRGQSDATRHTPRYATSRSAPSRWSLIAVATYLGFTKSIPFGGHYTVKAAFATANNMQAELVRARWPASTSARSPRSSACDKGQPQAVVTMRIDDKGRPIHKDATWRSARASSSRATSSSTSSPARRRRRSSPTARRSRQPDPAPVQLDQVLTALQSDTRQDLQLLLRELSKGLEGEAAPGLQPLDPLLGAARTGTRRSSTTRRSGKTEHDLSGYVENAGAVAAALDRNRDALKALITDFNTTARAFAVRDEELEPRSPSCRARCAPAARRWPRSTPRFPPLRRFVADFRPAVRSSGPALRGAQAVRARAARPGGPDRAARPGPRPAADRPGAGPAQRDACRCTSRCARPRAARTR